MQRFRSVLAAVAATFLVATASPAQDSDPGWPRETVKGGARLVTYQPQVDSWKDFKELEWRMAVSLTPKEGAKPIIGAVGLRSDTLVDNDAQMVLLADIRILRTNFPSLDAAASEEAARTLQAFVPQTTSISLHRIVASTPKSDKAPAVPVRSEPPAIFVASGPAVLVFVDGKPVRGKIPDTSLEFVVNTGLPLIVEGGSYYLLAGEQWMTAGALNGPWSAAKWLPREMDKLAKDAQWDQVAKFIPPPRNSKSPVPKVFYSETPGEVILFDGKPSFKRVAGTGLLYADNTDSPLLMHEVSKQYYYLTSGRWFRAAALEGPWSHATADLPGDFAQIPPASPIGRVRAAVPGTEEAKDAVLMAQVPTMLEVSPAAAAQVKVAYDGAPKFAPIPGTTLHYATNTADKVIQVGDVYYLCLQGVWFMSTTAQGPWQVAPSVPKEIYAIPSSSPVYNVTYVTQVTTPTGSVQSSYTAGYMGAFIVGTAVGYTVAYGSGYYHPPSYYYPPVGYPVYRPYPMPYGAPVYNTATGAYGWGQAAYGPYGSAARAATYNPYTGTYAKGATVSGPYGSRSAAQAYNPYTGTYAATRQGSSPTAQWGSSVVSKGGQAAYGQHYSTSAGTLGSVQTTAGGKALGASGAGGSSAAVGKTASGNMYATKDGNVYKNTGNGWQSYDNGGWNSAQQRTQGAPGSQSREGGSSQVQGLQQEHEARQRGSYQSHQFQGGERSRGGGGRRR